MQRSIKTMSAIRTRFSIFNTMTELLSKLVILELILLCVVLLCISHVSSIHQEKIVTAKSHKSFFNLETLVSKQNAGDGENHSRRKRSVIFTSEEVNTLLSLHQEFRRDVSPEAANMEYMTWDEDLATMAVQYSEKCVWGHGTVPNISPYSSYGQNLWIRGGTTQQPDAAPGVIAWHNEVDYYNLDKNSCKTGEQCGHYTQIVWASSRAVGCGLAFCETTENWSIPNSWILTCHYGPAGNYVGAKPYVTGASCTKCASHVGECYDNMCRLCSDHNEQCDCRQECEHCGQVNTNNCTCACPNGWYGPACENFCEDTHEYCGKSPGWPGPQFCDQHPAIPVGCPKMCGVCVDPDPDFQCENSTPETNLGDWAERNRTVPCINSTLVDNMNTSCPGVPPVEVTMCTDDECDTATSSTRIMVFRHAFTIGLSYVLVRTSTYI